MSTLAFVQTTNEYPEHSADIPAALAVRLEAIAVRQGYATDHYISAARDLLANGHLDNASFQNISEMADDIAENIADYADAKTAHKAFIASGAKPVPVHSVFSNIGA